MSNSTPLTITTNVTFKPVGPEDQFHLLNAPVPMYDEGLPLADITRFDFVVTHSATTVGTTTSSTTTGPFIEDDVFSNSWVEIDVDLSVPPVNETIMLEGPTRIFAFFEPNEGDATDDGGQSGQDEIQTEMVQLQLVGSSPVVGLVELRLSPSIPSLGQIEENQNGNPDRLDLRPFHPGTADSFFDVFFEIEFTSVPLAPVLHNQQPARIFNTNITFKPAAEEEMYSLAAPVQIFDPAGQPVGQMTGFRYVPFHSTTTTSTSSSTTTTTTTSTTTTSTTTTTTTIGLDFGDAPTNYLTLAVHNGPSHTTADPYFGDPAGAGIGFPDSDADGQPDPDALGDDNDAGWDDENGVIFPPLIHGLSTGVTIYVNGGIGGSVQVWVDANGDGSFAHPGEQIIAASYPTGVHTIAYSPPAGYEGPSFARARISSIAPMTPTGHVANGEVEDHRVYINDGIPDFCNLQHPPLVTTEVGVPTENIYGQVWINGVTTNAGATPGLVAELGYGDPGTDASTHPSWVWTSAAYNVDVGNNDEYVTTLTVPSIGMYATAYRYSWYGGAYCYGDTNDVNGTYDPAHNGMLIVTPPGECAKWRQPPDCAFGIDLQSIYWPGATFVADDFISDGRPITAIRWWGSYIGYTGPPTLPADPFGPDKGDIFPSRPLSFELTWYQDIPAGVEAPWSMPGAAITNVMFTLLPHGVPAPSDGLVQETFLCTTSYEPGPYPPFEHEYEYYVELEAPWLEKEGSIYWVAIKAFYGQPPETVIHPWGWKTTDALYNWNDDAVIYDPDEQTWVELIWPPPIPPWEAFDSPYNGQSLNLAFEILTDICPARCIKWQQPLELALGANMRSWRRLSDPPPGIWHRADDFVSDGRPITDIHWWGSYVGWLPETNGMREIDPIPSPTGFDRPLGFDLSWHLSDPEEFCHPGQLLTNIFVPIRKTHEVFYHSVLQFWEGPPRFEHEYQYYVDLLDLDVSGKPWFELEGTQYWLNIQAVFDDSFDPGPSHRGWGWSISPPLGLTPCPSVFMTNIVSGWEHAIMEPPHPLVGAPIDLAFELTTTQIPSNNSPWSSTIVLSNLVVDPVPPHMEVELVSHGYCPCGIQVLQQSVNLTNASAGFYDVQTNWVPRAVNTWRVPRWSSNSFYRVRKTNLY